MNIAESVENVVIITGMSGSGKSYVKSTLEDLGFYCTDNLPVDLIEPFLREVAEREGVTRIGIVVDVRTRNFAERFPEYYLNHLKILVPQAVLIFLEATEDALSRRFSETRRPHPVGGELPVVEAIQAEREALVEVKSLADMVVDTSQFSVHELKAEIIRRFQLPGDEVQMLVTIITFGFKYSTLYNVDLLFDVRFLPNPHFEEELRPKTGLDPEVVQYLQKQPEYERFIEKLHDFVAYLLPEYQKEMKSYLNIGIGCTGGKHRSVAVGQRLAEQLQQEGYSVEVVHRDRRR
ncbi:MAG: RNase adapter RapZ [Acidobacteriota bacterium]